VLVEYKSELLARKQNLTDNNLACWPNSGCKIKDTALAILALDHLGEDTTKAENWLLTKNKTASDIQWLLQEDSESETICKITYGQQDYESTIGADKKITKNAGNCLSVYSNGFWFQINPACYDKEFVVACDKNFIANLLYKKYGTGNTYYVDTDTKSSPALGSVSLKINSKCFGLVSCEYEGSLWAVLALLKTGHDVQAYAPYLIALSDSNKGFFSEAFLYMITGFEDYANWLIQKQKLGNYWEAEGTFNGKFYDTSLALIALKSSSSEQVARAKKQMEFFQDSSGCWMSNKMIRDTAMILWAIEGRVASINIGGGTTRCSEANYFCMSELECDDANKRNNYYCPNLQQCCSVQNTKTCSELNGKLCPSGKVCNGNIRDTTDISKCCLSDCIEPEQTTDCENAGNSCQTGCSNNQEETADSCNGVMICCKNKAVTISEPTQSKLWIWLVVIGIIVLIAIIIYTQKDKLKLMLFKKRNNVQQGSGLSFGGPGFRPSFPPGGIGMRPMPARPVFSQARPASSNRPASQISRESDSVEEDETFKKLREMSR
jgi:hypothetical protein